MRLSDVLKVIGTSKLIDFPWGESVVDLVNSFTPDDTTITLESSGAEVEAAIAKVDQTHLPILLQAKVIRGKTAGNGRLSSTVLGHIDSHHKAKALLLMLFTGTLCLIAVMLSFGIGYDTIVNGKPGDFSVLKDILGIIRDVLIETGKPPA